VTPVTAALDARAYSLHEQGDAMRDAPVDRLERFDFGGPAQWALVRGHSSKSPVLLLVQAGPGLPLIHEAAATERRLRLEESHRVVYWDQRGTGKSFDAKDRETITLDTLVGDIRSMVEALCDRLDVSEVDVVAFSMGASLALLACAGERKKVRSLTCVGPDVNLLEAERFAWQFALAEAEGRNHERALEALRLIGEPPHADPKRFTERVWWVVNFGGVHRGKNALSLVGGTLMRMMTSPHYSLGESVGAIRGLSATQERLLPLLQGFDLLEKPLDLRVPVVIFQGRHDAAAPPRLAPELGKHIGADVIWFEESAHSPHEEEPVRFRAELDRFLSSVGHR
jgi:pimeloyl-ACP methyl ester carboxylesterase